MTNKVVITGIGIVSPIGNKLQSFTGSKGLFVLANTAGYHRKGIHNSSKPRIILACGVKRKGVISKFLINLVAMVKFKFIQERN